MGGVLWGDAILGGAALEALDEAVSCWPLSATAPEGQGGLSPGRLPREAQRQTNGL